jgi:hypothetical protein
LVTPKHCTVHAAYCVLFAGPVCLLLIQHNPQCAVEFILQHSFFRFSLCTIWPLPGTYPSFVTTLLASRPMPHSKMSCTLFHVLHPFFRIILPCSWPLPCPKTFCTSYHTLYPVSRISLPAISPPPHPKTLCTLYHILYPVFWTSLIASWPLPRHKTLCTSYHILHCFQDQFSCWLSTALPQNIVHFVSCTVPLFQDRFVGQFATA